jgi:hypothetical protein
MSMYLPNDDVGPTGAEGAEFVDVPLHAPDGETENDATSQADEPDGGQGEEPGMETEAGG